MIRWAYWKSNGKHTLAFGKVNVRNGSTNELMNVHKMQATKISLHWNKDVVSWAYCIASAENHAYLCCNTLLHVAGVISGVRECYVRRYDGEVATLLSRRALMFCSNMCHSVCLKVSAISQDCVPGRSPFDDPSQEALYYLLILFVSVQNGWLQNIIYTFVRPNLPISSTCTVILSLG
jgi:hypothetical protein